LSRYARWRGLLTRSTSASFCPTQALGETYLLDCASCSSWGKLPL
jgi:hypothetical protein